MEVMPQLEINKNFTFTLKGKSNTKINSKNTFDLSAWESSGVDPKTAYEKYVTINESTFGYTTNLIKKLANKTIFGLLSVLTLMEKHGDIVESISKIIPDAFDSANFLAKDKDNNSIFNSILPYILILDEITSCSNKNKTLYDKLAINKEIFSKISDEDLILHLGEISQLLKKKYTLKSILTIYNKKLEFKRMYDLADSQYDETSEYLNYILENDMWDDFDKNNCSHYLNDWIRQLNEVKQYDENIKFHLCHPSNIKKYHDDVSNAYRYYSARIENEKHIKLIENYKVNIYPLLSKWNYENDEFVIYAPECVTKLDFEGQEMHHCVASYKWQLAQGQSEIFFVRRKEDLEKPFVTVEVRGLSDPHPHVRLIQRRAKYNNDPSKECKKFIDDWLDYIEKELKK